MKAKFEKHFQTAKKGLIVLGVIFIPGAIPATIAYAIWKKTQKKKQDAEKEQKAS